MPPKKVEESSQLARFGRVKNSLKMGILGMPNVGKSSFFNLICKMEIAAENYPFCTIEPNESRCSVTDSRMDYLSEMYKPQRTQPAYLHITDIAGLVAGAAEGAGLGNAFLSHVAAVDGLFHVVRAFDDKDVLHVENSVDPVRDLNIIQLELCKKDLALAQKEFAALDAKKRINNKITPSQAVLEKAFLTMIPMLEEGKPVASHQWANAEIVQIRENLPGLLTTKPIIYLVNMGIKSVITGENKYMKGIEEWVEANGGGKIIPFSVKFEEGLFANREDPVKLAGIIEKAGAGSRMDEIIHAGYEALSLIYFFTCGPLEVRAWTILEGSTAPQAAGVIHGDFEKCFIKAETCAFEDFKALATKPNMDEIKGAGKYRQEGKLYVVKSGDILNIQHNARK